MNEPNVYAGRQEQIEQGISNIPLGDQEPAEFDDWDEPITTPLVAETLSFLGVPVRGEQEWEYGLHRVLEEMTTKVCSFSGIVDCRSRFVAMTAAWYGPFRCINNHG